MTAKRFTLEEFGLNFIVNDNGRNLTAKQTVDRLNEFNEENEQLNQFKKQVFQIIDDNIKIYEDTTTNDEFLQIQLDTKLQTLYNLRKELLK